MEKNVQLKYRLYRRRNGVFYWQENDSKKQGSLRTSDRREADRLLNAMNESHREPTLNLNLARAYLAAHDPKMAQRTWQAVMDEMATHGIPSTQARCARGFRSKAYDAIRSKPLVQTTGEDLLAIKPGGDFESARGGICGRGCIRERFHQRFRAFRCSESEVSQ